jgi:hypothetical protein
VVYLLAWSIYWRGLSIGVVYLLAWSIYWRGLSIGRIPHAIIANEGIVKKQEQGVNVLDLHSSIIITGETYYNQPAIQPDDATPYGASPLVLSLSYSFTSITNSRTSHEIAQPSKDYQSPIIT